MSLASGVALRAASGLITGLTTGLNSAAKYAGAGQRANGVSAAAQAKAANFNQSSADNANAINAQTLSNQYGFNSGQWAQAANWNESMFNQSMAFNAEQAELQRQWAEHMESTKYQRAVGDMKAAGLNPVLAATGGGISVGSGGGGAASVSAPSMGAATGGLLGANDASISGYTGQMEYYSGLMGMLAQGLGGLSSAVKAFANMPSNVIKGTSDLIEKFIDSNSGDKVMGIDMSKGSTKKEKDFKKQGGFYTNNGIFGKKPWDPQ